MTEDPDITGEHKHTCGDCHREYKDGTEYNDGSIDYIKPECPNCGSNNVSKKITFHN
ncbi:MAG: hypothetical protein ACLFQ8_02480 [Candidatus Aenigmatarchaeota archaeon]